MPVARAKLSIVKSLLKEREGTFLGDVSSCGEKEKRKEKVDGQSQSHFTCKPNTGTFPLKAQVSISQNPGLDPLPLGKPKQPQLRAPGVAEFGDFSDSGFELFLLSQSGFFPPLLLEVADEVCLL